MYIKIYNDMWEDAGKEWRVLEYSTRPDSTACRLILEDCSTKEISHRTVASHQIKWLEAKD